MSAVSPYLELPKRSEAEVRRVDYDRMSMDVLRIEEHRITARIATAATMALVSALNIRLRDVRRAIARKEQQP